MKRGKTSEVDFFYFGLDSVNHLLCIPPNYNYTVIVAQDHSLYGDNILSSNGAKGVARCLQLLHLGVDMNTEEVELAHDTQTIREILKSSLPASAGELDSKFVSYALQFTVLIHDHLDK